jgi:8-oxo-dGTP diphosphatase
MNYVVGFLRDESDSVLLVRKLKPKWQAGHLNGIGGKIEDGETAISAMIREWKEETGLDFADWREFCVLRGPDYAVHFFAGVLDTLFEEAYPQLDCWNLPMNDIGEQLEYVSLEQIRDEKCIQNLRWLLPMAFDDTSMPYAAVMDVGVVAPKVAVQAAA